MNKKFKTLFYDKKFIIALSIVIAIGFWLIVVLFIDNVTTKVIKNVPVNIDGGSPMITRLNLNPITDTPLFVDVEVTGGRGIIGNLTPEDIYLAADLSTVTGAGTYELPVFSVNTNKNYYTISATKPQTISVKFEKLVERKMEVSVEISGVKIPNGFFMEKEIISPVEITITGPEDEITNVARCVVKLELTDELQKTTTYKRAIDLYDAQGKLIDTRYILLSTTDADITIPILKKKEVPVTVTFINTPPNFDTSKLKYTLTTDTIEIAGPKESIDNYGEINLGYIDLTKLDLSKSQILDVSLPPGYINLENINVIEVDFSNTNVTSKKFNVSNINAVNKPSNYDVKINTNKIANVTLIGETQVLNSITANDIVAEIDLSDRDIKEGQYKVPVKIFSPNNNFIWVNGEYEAVVTVTKK